MNIFLLANDRPGVEVARHLVSTGDTITHLYLHPEEKRSFGDELVEAARVDPQNVFSAKLVNDQEHIQRISAMRPDFIITVYWAYLLPPRFYHLAVKTINFHPALLPLNRGWYPHVHSILDGTPTGVTLHEIEEEADTGPIWVQKQVQLRETDTADVIYYRLQDEMIQLFVDHWVDIKSGRITPKPQDHKKALYHHKNEITALDEIDLDAPTTARSLINLLKARTFSDKGFAYYRVDDKKITVRISLAESES